MKIKKLNLSGLSIIQPNIFHDKRGFLWETYNENLYLKLIKSKIVQVIHSHSKKIQLEEYIFNIRIFKVSLFLFFKEKYLMCL